MTRQWVLLIVAVLLVGLCVPHVAFGEAAPGVEAAVEALIQALGDEYWEVRSTAAEALGKIFGHTTE